MEMANLKSLWHKKIIRAWIVILIPLAVLFGYGSYLLKEKSMLMEDNAKLSLFYPFVDEKTDSDTVAALSKDPDYPKEATEFFHLRDKYALESNICSIMSGILLFFPALVWIFAKVYHLIMYGTVSVDKRLIKYAAWLVSIVFAIAAICIIGVKKKEEAPATVPSEAEQKRLQEKFDKITDDILRQDAEKQNRIHK
jgi:magnesium-transporting ATPase (P-type)